VLWFVIAYSCMRMWTLTLSTHFVLCVYVCACVCVCVCVCGSVALWLCVSRETFFVAGVCLVFVLTGVGVCIADVGQKCV